MKKAYVYKVCASGRVSANLQTAIANAVKDIAKTGKRSSQPITVKCNGGYKVMIFDEHGKMFSRRIDVFVPDNFEVAKPFMVDECYENPKILVEDALYNDDDIAEKMPDVAIKFTDEEIEQMSDETIDEICDDNICDSCPLADNDGYCRPLVREDKEGW